MILTGYLAFWSTKALLQLSNQSSCRIWGNHQDLNWGQWKVTQAVCGSRTRCRADSFGKRNRYDDWPELAQVVKQQRSLPNYRDQKARIILCLRTMATRWVTWERWDQRAPSMKVSDVGISVDTAVDIAKETADVILLDKDLMVLEKVWLKVARSM